MSYSSLTITDARPWFAEIAFDSLSDFFVWKLKQGTVYPFEQFVFRGHSRCGAYKLLPTALQYKEKKKTLISFLIGILFMYVNHMLSY